ncbi:MAG: iron ABC transporter permease [Lachnospiraceae bacterium]|nr:iron ABC transporter permease [Lachnospiraceae bacterium]
MKSGKRYTFTVLALCLLLMTVFLFSFLVGRFRISPVLAIDIITAGIRNLVPYWDSTLEKVVLQVRFPRIMLAVLVGGTLSVSGASYQTVFKNPMVSPDILGVSAGAGFGAAWAMISGGSWIDIQIRAFLFGILAVTAAYLIAWIFGGQSITVLVLAGVVVSSFFQALLSIIKTLADTESELPSITFWLMGSLSKGDMKDALHMIYAAAFALGLLFLFRNQINTLASGEDVASTMGVNVNLVKLIVIAASTLMTVVSVSICGIVGWVGMVIPHLARMLVGAEYKKMAVTSFLAGGTFLLLVDNIIRGVEGAELPLGVLTALIGTPVFAILLTRVKRGWD